MKELQSSPMDDVDDVAVDDAKLKKKAADLKMFRRQSLREFDGQEGSDGSASANQEEILPLEEMAQGML